MNAKVVTNRSPQAGELISVHPVWTVLSPCNVSEVALSFHICIPWSCGQAGMQVKQMLGLWSHPPLRPNHDVAPVCISSAGGTTWDQSHLRWNYHDWLKSSRIGLPVSISSSIGYVLTSLRNIWSLHRLHWIVTQFVN